MIHLFRRGWMLYNCKRHYESLGFKQGGLLTIKKLKTNTSHHTKVESRWCVCLLLCSFSFLNVVFCFMHFKNWIIPIYLSFLTQCLYDFQLIYSTPLSSALYVSLTLCCFSASLAFPLLFYMVLNYFHFFNLSVFFFQVCRPYLPENICWLPFQLACACFSPMPFPSFPPPPFISVALKLFNLFISFLFWHRHPHFMNHYLHHCPSLPSFLQISFHLLYYLKLPYPLYFLCFILSFILPLPFWTWPWTDIYRAFLPYCPIKEFLFPSLMTATCLLLFSFFNISSLFMSL